MAFEPKLISDWGIQRFKSEKLYYFLRLQNDPFARWIVARTLIYRAGTPVGVRFSGPIQNGREAHPNSCTICLFPRW